MNIYVGNIDRKTTEDELRLAFEEFGAVISVALIKDKFTGESRGFGFVEMSEEEEAKAAMAGLNGKEFGGRTLTVNEARPKTSNGGSRGGSMGGGASRRPGGSSSSGNRSGGSSFGGSRSARW